MLWVAAAEHGPDDCCTAVRGSLPLARGHTGHLLQDHAARGRRQGTCSIFQLQLPAAAAAVNQSVSLPGHCLQPHTLNLTLTWELQGVATAAAAADTQIVCFLGQGTTAPCSI